MKGGENEFVDGYHLLDIIRHEHPEVWSTMIKVPIEWLDTGITNGTSLPTQNFNLVQKELNFIELSWPLSYYLDTDYFLYLAFFILAVENLSVKCGSCYIMTTGIPSWPPTCCTTLEILQLHITQ